GLVFPAGAIGLYLLLTGNFRHLLKLRLLSSAAVFFAIAAPWHILAALRNPAQGQVRGFLWFYFVNEHILRFLNRRVPRDYDTVPLLLFWALLVLWLIPWTVFLPQSLREVPRRWREFRMQMTRRQRAYLLFFLWNVVIVGFFSLSTRQEYYTIPAIPGMALLVGGWLQRERASGADFVVRVAGSRRHHRGGWLCTAPVLEGAKSGHGSVGPAAETSARLRAFVRAFSRFDPAGNGGIPGAVVWILARISARNARQLAPAASRAGGSGECGAGGDDGGSAGVRADCVRHFFSDSFVERPGDGDSRTVPARRSDRGDRAV